MDNTKLGFWQRFFKAGRDALYISLVTVAVMFIFANINLNLEFLNPIQTMFNDFDATDIVFSRLREDPKHDNRVVLVNIGNLGRPEVAQIITTLNQYQPRVIAIDAFFRRDSPEPHVDSLMIDALSKVKHLVLVSGLAKPNEKAKRFDSLELSNPKFVQYARTGFANLTTKGAGNQEEFVTCRHFIPQAKIGKKGTKEVAFGVRVAEVYAPDKAKKFLARDKESEYINYWGNVTANDGGEITYTALNYDQVLNHSPEQPQFTPEIIKDKIVLLGFMGEEHYTKKSYVDKFYTPLNQNYVGKSTLDMFGVVVHANIITMILNEDYINETPDWAEYLLTLLVCYACAALFAYFFRHLGFWYDAVTLFAQLFISLVLFTLMLYAFHWYNLRLNINAALLSVAFVGILVEMYYGVLDKLVERWQRRQAAKHTRSEKTTDNVS